MMSLSLHMARTLTVEELCALKPEVLEDLIKEARIEARKSKAMKDWLEGVLALQHRAQLSDLTQLPPLEE